MAVVDAGPQQISRSVEVQAPCGRVVRPEAVFEGKVSDFVIRHTYRMMFADYQQRKYDWPSLMLRILMIHRLTAGVAVYGAIAGRRVL